MATSVKRSIFSYLDRDHTYVDKETSGKVDLDKDRIIDEEMFFRGTVREWLQMLGGWPATPQVNDIFSKGSASISITSFLDALRMGQIRSKLGLLLLKQAAGNLSAEEKTELDSLLAATSIERRRMTVTN